MSVLTAHLTLAQLETALVARLWVAWEEADRAHKELGTGPGRPSERQETFVQKLAVFETLAALVAQHTGLSESTVGLLCPEVTVGTYPDLTAGLAAAQRGEFR